MHPLMKKVARTFYYLFQSKQNAELHYWQKCYKKENYTFQRHFYATLMLSMVEESDDSFLKNRIVADFGCGPRGSLTWAKSAKERIGIDVLVPQFQKYFADELQSHNMTYVASSETKIPLPDASVDVLFTMNSLDHVTHLEIMCNELRRILKPGGLLIGSFNLNEPAHKAEPQMLEEARLTELLFEDFEILAWKVSQHDGSAYKYKSLLEGNLIPPEGKPAILWAKAQKPTQQ